MLQNVALQIPSRSRQNAKIMYTYEDQERAGKFLPER